MQFRQVVLIRSKDFGNKGRPLEGDNLCNVEDQLELARGQRVYMTSNLCTTWGLTNGSAGIVVDIIPGEEAPGQGLPKAVIVKFDNYSGPNFHETEKDLVPIAPIVANFDYKDKKVVRKGFPLRQAEAITIHKAQGQSYDIVIVDIGTKEITVGQTYTAMSRCRNSSNLILYDLTKDDWMDRFNSKNCVHLYYHLCKVENELQVKFIATMREFVDPDFDQEIWHDIPSTEPKFIPKPKPPKTTAKDPPYTNVPKVPKQQTTDSRKNKEKGEAPKRPDVSSSTQQKN